ncbi:MAG: hypothetical protein AAGF06_04620 [Pseudomonadota bacterium]
MKFSSIIKYFWFLPWLLVAGVVLGGVFWSGYFFAKNSADVMDQRSKKLRAVVSNKDKTIAGLQRKVAQSKIGDQLDKQVVVEVQKQLSESERRLADQADELSYYKERLNPKGSDDAVKIRSVTLHKSKSFEEVLDGVEKPLLKNATLKDKATASLSKAASIAKKTTATAHPNYVYKLVLQSGNMEEEVVTVSADIEFEDKGGKAKKIAVTKPHTVRFKYFKSMRENVTVPSSIEPKRIVIAVKTESGQLVTNSYNWEIVN